ncbi:MAG: phosphatase PAP2 family protein [Burkholderiaceae bacterium]|nr:phosphatase PAP2 family protein [Burkholderiaceae bacterium]
MPMSYVDAFWHGVTRLGEAQILLPTAVALALWLAWRAGAQRLAARWLLCIACAVAVTTASKVAFMGFGWGWPALDFTGVSGHAMFASAILPVVCMALACGPAGGTSAAWQRTGLAVGVALALLVGISRAVIGAHSWAEIVAGWIVGGVAAAAVLRAVPKPSARLPLWLPVVVSLWLGTASAKAPPSATHGLVTRWSLALSGRSQPYTRSDMLTAWRLEQQRVSAPR